MPTVTLQLTVTLGDDALRVLGDVIGAAIRDAVRQTGGQIGDVRLPRTDPLFAGQPVPQDQGTLIGVREVAKLLKVSVRHVVRVSETGEIPPPIRIGRAVRWSRDALTKWIADGCPRVQTG
jgi:excisionase family DNA binding protein